jgi:hypothetical protein
LCNRSCQKVNTIQIVPVAPTAMHKRVGLSENDGMRSFLSRVNIWVYYLSGSKPFNIRAIVDLDLISLVRSGTAGSFS